MLSRECPDLLPPATRVLKEGFEGNSPQIPLMRNRVRILEKSGRVDPFRTTRPASLPLSSTANLNWRQSSFPSLFPSHSLVCSHFIMMSFVLLLSLFAFLFDLILQRWIRIRSAILLSADDELDLPDDDSAPAIDLTTTVLSSEADLADDESALAMDMVLAPPTEIAARVAHQRLISVLLQTSSGLILTIGLSRDGMLFASLFSLHAQSTGFDLAIPRAFFMPCYIFPWIKVNNSAERNLVVKRNIGESQELTSIQTETSSSSPLQVLPLSAHGVPVQEGRRSRKKWFQNAAVHEAQIQAVRRSSRKKWFENNVGPQILQGGRRSRKKWSLSGLKIDAFVRKKEDKIERKRALKAKLLKEKSQKARDLRWGKEKNQDAGFLSKYKLLRQIGKGGFGFVYEAALKNNRSFGLFAVKIIPKTKTVSVDQEIEMLKKLTGHGNGSVVKFYEHFEDVNRFYIVMELCTGGNMYEKLQRKPGGKCTEIEARKWMVQVLNAIAFCHRRGTVHRDIKPENFIFATDDKDMKIKLIDFGLSSTIGAGERLTDRVGTRDYMAPEVFKRSAGFESDAWSAGILAYELLAGKCPFDFSGGVLFSQLRPDFSGPAWHSVSSQAKDFISRLLRVDCATRMTVQEALDHEWISRC